MMEDCRGEDSNSDLNEYGFMQNGTGDMSNPNNAFNVQLNEIRLFVQCSLPNQSPPSHRGNCLFRSRGGTLSEDMKERRNLENTVGMETDLVKKAFSLAMAAQSKHDQPYQSENHSSYSIFAFRGSGTVEDWFSGTPFGETSIGLKKLFPSLKSIGKDEIAAVNGKFFQRFQDLLRQEALKEEFRLSDDTRLEHLLKDSRLSDKVRRAVGGRRKVVFTGYSSGAPIAIFVAILFLQQNRIPALCVTFGSPLVGNQIFGHALRRENWAQYFVHFIMRNDIIPRVLLAPLSSLEGELQTILPCFDPSKLESKARSTEASSSFYEIMRNALSVVSYTACSFMGCTNTLLQIITSFIDLSPYRPFGTYVFCTGDGRMFSINNPDAILQLLFYTLQLDNGVAVTDVAYRSFKDHLGYETEFKDNLGKEDVVDLEHLDLQLPLSTGGVSSREMKSIETAIMELGLSTKAMLCLIAARESEKQKQRNQDRIDNDSYKIEDALRKLQDYKDKGEMSKIGYYDAFKSQTEQEDYLAYLTRLELAAIWDQIIEMLSRHELPDGFECRKDWVELGTRLRRLLEPIDIANYYRYSRARDAGPYMKPEEARQSRPSRYRYTQRWLEHAEGKPAGYFLESCFWAEVEELSICIHTNNQKENRDAAFEKVKDRVLKLEENVLLWVQDNRLSGDVFLENSTFVRWWRELPEGHRMVSRIAALMCGRGIELPSATE